jgi:hypothetical protein
MSARVLAQCVCTLGASARVRDLVHLQAWRIRDYRLGASATTDLVHSRLQTWCIRDYRLGASATTDLVHPRLQTWCICASTRVQSCTVLYSLQRTVLYRLVQSTATVYRLVQSKVYSIQSTDLCSLKSTAYSLQTCAV